MRVVVAVDGPAASRLVDGLASEGIEVIATLDASEPAIVADERHGGSVRPHVAGVLEEADALVIAVDRTTMSAALVARADRWGLRIVPLGSGSEAEHIVVLHRLEPLREIEIEPWRLADVLSAAPLQSPASTARSAHTIVVWGAAGAPGRSTVAIELAVELARGGRRSALIDADSHAPSIALALGLPDEGPGFAAACRQAEHGTLDMRELSRISVTIERSGVDVLTGINRPSRWPELSDSRVRAVLAAARTWSEFTVVDVAASLERDEEIVSDVEGARRNAATLAALASADIVVAVVGADPVGVSRFLRSVPDLRASIDDARLVVAANRLRPGTIGVDARGHVRRAIERFSGLRNVWFLPQDPRSADAALLAGRPIAEVSPRSPFVLGVRRLVGDAIAQTPEPAQPPHRRRATRTSTRAYA